MLNHLLFVIVVVAMPLLSGWKALRMKRAGEQVNKTQGYVMTITISWVVALAMIAVNGFGSLFTFQHRIQLGTEATVLLFICLGYFVLTTVMPLLLLRNETFRGHIRAEYERKKHLFPVTSKEVTYYVVLAVSVGICEEIMYRSFLASYLYDLPFELSWQASFALAALLFGLVHLTQGIPGMIGSGVLGLLLGYVFVATGSLLLPIVIHILYDLKLLLFVSPQAQKAR